MRNFVRETMSHAKSSLHWSVIHYQMTFEWHTGCGLKISIREYHMKFRLLPQYQTESQIDVSGNNPNCML